MIIREKDPANLEMPFGELEGFLTPNEQFYIRSHFPVPETDLATWRLRIEGKVQTAREFSLEDLRKLPATTLPATLECAGNGRVFLVPKVKGAQWGLGAVGNAEWTGVSLGEILRASGIETGATEVILEGADRGKISDPPKPAGEIHYARSVPLGKALEGVLLASEMNGEPLTPAHGFPLRAIVPGWYGMAAVKWLQRIIVTDRPFNGYYQTVDYAFWQRDDTGVRLIPITEMHIKASIARPGINEVVAAGSTCKVAGAAWTAEADIVKVELSTDGGSSWKMASLGKEKARHSWQLWEYDWSVPSTPGRRVLLARATDSRGRTQPMERDPDRGSYEINHCLPLEVEVR
ncbi:MAG: sulfite oxidase [Verrucomicrobiota bacterium]|nr:sulfite oxidase [Verrucomicrobiota bacterium]